MRWWFALEAEVFESGEEATGEADCPESVDRDAGGEGIVWIGGPGRKSEAIVWERLIKGKQGFDGEVGVNGA